MISRGLEDCAKLLTFTSAEKVTTSVSLRDDSCPSDLRVTTRVSPSSSSCNTSQTVILGL